MLIRAVERLIRQGQDIALWIVGDGDEETKLRTLIDSTHNPDRIRLAGHVNDVRPFLEALDLFVISSHTEALPNVALEAMAMEVPVVATRVGGLPALIVDRVSGILVSPGCESQLKHGILQLLDDETMRRSLVRSGRATVERAHSFERRMEHVADVYHKVLDSCRESDAAGNILVARLN